MKICMWLAGPDVTLGRKAISVLRHLYGVAEVIGVTGREKYPVDLREEGYEGGFMAPEAAEELNPDAVLMTGNQYWPFGYSARDVCAVGGNNISCKILLDRVVCMPGFTVEKYERLKESRLSILSQQCFGGILSHMLDLPFLSPTVNLFMLPMDGWIDFLEQPQVYLSKKLIFLQKGLIEEQQFEYPIYSLLNVNVFMNHHRINEADVAEKKWYERIERINWDNILVVMQTEEQGILERFDRLPYKKKACFVPFESSLEAAFYININNDLELSLPDALNRSAYGWNDVWYYDWFDLLLDGKKTPVL